MERVFAFDDVASWLDAHHLLVMLPEFSALGDFHAHLDTADRAVSAQLHDELPAGMGDFKRLEMTSFGREVGGDVPRWWVFHREPDVPALWNDTKLAFLAAQTLVRSAERVAREAARTYDDVIRQLASFVQRHGGELETLRRYAASLLQKDALGPAILFSYAVWGSTRRADRTLEGYALENQTETVRLAGELAIGIRRRTAPTLFWEWLHLLNDAGEAASDDEYLSVPVGDLLRVAQMQIRENLITYFTELRDSFRHIDTLCQEFFQREHLYADDKFIQRLMKKVCALPAVTENDLWDIKETLTVWSCPPEQRAAGAVQFAEDVAAFANSRGGLLLIGISDATRTVVGVPDTENRLKHAEGILRRHIEPQLDFFRLRAVPTGTSHTNRMCLVVVVGRTDEPVGVRQMNGTFSYPIRVGAGIQRSSPKQIWVTKGHQKGTNFTFASELAMWVSDVRI